MIRTKKNLLVGRMLVGLISCYEIQMAMFYFVISFF